MNSIIVAFLLISAIAAVDGYRMSSPMMTRPILKRSIVAISMSSDDDKSAPKSNRVTMAEADVEDKEMFDMNKRVRLGRSRDQDGKSNIWSIEPTMQVEEEEEGSLKKNLFVGGIVIGGALACLPLFNAFSSLFPDPADF